jgi:hypothetical protein
MEGNHPEIAKNYTLKNAGKWILPKKKLKYQKNKTFYQKSA